MERAAVDPGDLRARAPRRADPMPVRGRPGRAIFQMTPRDTFYIAQHEAAHTVVGLTCGLRLIEARIGSDPELRSPGHECLGVTWLSGRSQLAWALAVAAGVAIDRR